MIEKPEARIDAKTIIDRWPMKSVFSRDIGLKHYQTGYRMWCRNSIDKRHWENVVAAARRRGIAVTYEDLVAAHTVTEAAQ